MSHSHALKLHIDSFDSHSRYSPDSTRFRHAVRCIITNHAHVIAKLFIARPNSMEQRCFTLALDCRHNCVCTMRIVVLYRNEFLTASSDVAQRVFTLAAPNSAVLLRTICVLDSYIEKVAARCNSEKICRPSSRFSLTRNSECCSARRRSMAATSFVCPGVLASNYSLTRRDESDEIRRGTQLVAVRQHRAMQCEKSISRSRQQWYPAMTST